MRATRRWLGAWVVAGLVAVAAAVPAEAFGQVISLARGTSTTVSLVSPAARVFVADPAIADYNLVSPREILVIGRTVGTTTLIVWDANDNRRVFTVEVGVDAAALERQLRTLFPGEEVRVSASGNTVIVTGTVSSGIAQRRIVSFVQSTGATVLDELTAPTSAQVMLQVRIAEISRSAARAFGIEALGINVGDLGPLREAEIDVANLAGELTRIAIIDGPAQLDVAINALKTNGMLQVLAQPNLLALDGVQASFLAGGEFPYPVVQTTGGGSAFSVQFKEFGVRLNFTPNVTAAGTVRLQVAPEVSQLDFGNAVQISGFVVPALRTRRAQTTVELRPGQTLAIAGLLDNSLSRNVEKVPFLGDIPILGLLFRSTNYRQNRSELVVLVTPTLVAPSDAPLPVPTGEPDTWQWEPTLRRPLAPPPVRRP